MRGEGGPAGDNIFESVVQQWSFWVPLSILVALYGWGREGIRRIQVFGLVDNKTAHCMWQEFEMSSGGGKRERRTSSYLCRCRSWVRCNNTPGLQAAQLDGRDLSVQSILLLFCFPPRRVVFSSCQGGPLKDGLSSHKGGGSAGVWARSVLRSVLGAVCWY